MAHPESRLGRGVARIGFASLFCLGSVAVLPTAPVGCQSQPGWRADVPRTWDEERLATMELPNAVTGRPQRHVPASYYEAIPPTVIYRTYPLYDSAHEPEGYIDRLRSLEPEVVFDARALRTREDWIRAGELVFRWPTSFRPLPPPARSDRAGDGDGDGDDFDDPLTKDGRIEFASYVIREKGRIEIGAGSCATCHIRVMPDGTSIVGAQGNVPSAQVLLQRFRIGVIESAVLSFGMPEVEGHEPPMPRDMTEGQYLRAIAGCPPGVIPRRGTSPFSPVQVPDLIGIADRKYLDRTGLVRHRGIGDLMRYAALNQDLDYLSDLAGFVPAIASRGAPLASPVPADGAPARDAALPDPSTRFRYSDEQLYALALYLYSLTPPPNPNVFDALAERGKGVFERERCARCHKPPLYTNNALTPVDGFEVPASLRKTDKILRRRVGTDPRLALTTRRGTGFYKVPSLLGVWYRGPFSHDGSVATLEDWFDEARLGDDYRPTGWNATDEPRAVKGHRFGLDLSDEDKQALIAFLRTL